QEIRDVRTRERQFEAGIVASQRIAVVGDQPKEARHLLLRRLSAERQHPVAGFVEFLESLAVEKMFKTGGVADQALDRPAGKDAYFGIHGRFGAHAALAEERTTHEIRRELKSNDLLAAIRHDLRELDHSVEDAAVGGDAFPL